MKPELYSFCFLRYVHEPLSGEFANVGVLLWAPQSRFLGFRATQKFSRLSHFFHGFHSDDHRNLISRIETQFRKLADGLAHPQGALPFADAPASARDLALRVIPHDDVALQWSLSGGGLTANAEAELEMLFHESVGRHYESPEEARRDDGVVYREIYSKAFESPVVRSHIVEHEVISPHASHVFHQAWKNGVWNVYQTLSFDYKRSDNIKTKAYHWESLSRFLSQSPEHPQIHLLLAAPSDESNHPAYSKAKDVLHASQVVKIIEEDEAADFARDLEKKILKAG
ncbi:MAG: DUF3037 domain-containing protein [Verrucomicrobiota bacterium]